MWRLATTTRRNPLLLPLVLANAVRAISAMTPSSPAASASHQNVLLASSRLVPLYGTMTVAHQTRQKVFDLLQETIERRQTDGDNTERAMIVDISATTWNWDTYAIVAGSPSPIKLVFPDEEALRKHLPLDEDESAPEGILVPQLSLEETAVRANDSQTTATATAKHPTMVWVPKGATLKETNERDDGLVEFVLEAPVDPNDDRLEHWEQEVVGKQWLRTTRAELATDCLRNMLRFYDLDRIVCWDLSWGVWEAVSESDETSDEVADDDGFPKMSLVKDGMEKLTLRSLDAADDCAIERFYEYAQPITPELLAESLKSVSGYYLVGGNTYTMSLFHHMWDQQTQKEDGIGELNGHMQLLRDLLADGTLFYLGHSAGAIMSGPNILTATFKGIDAFSVVTQPYNAPYLKLPPSVSPETFFATEKNNLQQARTKMLETMNAFGAWRGYRVVEALAFPHYDSRPRFASFPQSAETYLRATDKEGRFAQPDGSLLVGPSPNDRAEPEDVTTLREATNAQKLPCYPIANGHSIVLDCGGSEVVGALSPEEDGGGTLHWDTYMPNVPDPDWLQYASGRTEFTAGSFTDDANTMAGDRSESSEYRGARILSRLDALGLPNPLRERNGGEGLFRAE